ncbi:hypothetical protein ACQZ4Y_19455 [Rhizobium sp. L80/93]
MPALTDSERFSQAGSTETLHSLSFYSLQFRVGRLGRRRQSDVAGQATAAADSGLGDDRLSCMRRRQVAGVVTDTNVTSQDPTRPIRRDQMDERLSGRLDWTLSSCRAMRR